MTKVFNRTEEKGKRKKLRRNMPQAEVLLWSRLKNKRLKDYRFRRQYSVGKYVIDFYCPKLKLAIEIDGESHFTEKAEIRDKLRQYIIESYGIEFMRFTNREIYENIDGVLLAIMERFEKATSPSPSLVMKGD
ncbi:hypothetical protein BMS3Abin07_02214 [bacterium BMS3Abin07]|nr:hypothetical protein BMS3Abin07_02214 [bacterium BMS3Abin07]HDH02443.1 DUF559 domain-containing protein [Nitrospirota bacterium]